MQKARKKLSIVLLVAFLLTMALPVSGWAAGSTFSDVPSDHWAKQQIARMNLRGIIVGYDDGTARPDNPVTQFEAVVMAVRLMGIADKAKAVSKGTPLPVTVPSYDGAYETGVVAYEAGLIDSTDFTHSKAASREWVAKLLVKILGKESMAASVAGEWLSFTDASSISSSYLSYVKIANNLGLIGGYTDGSFKPRNTVTRAEMAAFLTRAEDQMVVSASNLLIGTVTNVNGINITISDGQTSKSVFATNNSAMYDANGKAITATTLPVNSYVYAIFDGSLLSYLEIRPANAVNPNTNTNTPSAISKRITGTVNYIATDKKTIVVKDTDGQLTTVLLDGDTAITRENSTIALTTTDLGLNATVVVVMDSDQVAQSIVIKSEGNPTTKGGSIHLVDVYNKLIIMSETDGLKTYTMADDISVSIAGMLTATTSNLKTGDMATYEVTGSVMNAIAVGGSAGVAGGTATIVSVDTSTKLINYTNASGELRAGYYNNNTVFVFNNEVGKAANLQTGDAATLTMSGNTISRVEVDSRKLSEGSKGLVYAVDPTNRILFIDFDGNIKNYPVSHDAIITIYDEVASLTSVKKDMTVEISVVNGTITYINASNSVSGTVVNVNYNTNYLEILPDDATVTSSYNVSSRVRVYDYSTSSTSFSVVDVGDEVTIRLNNSLVTQIDVVSKVDYVVESTYSSSSSRLLVSGDDFTNNRNLYISSSVELVIAGTSKPRVSDISIGDELIATYRGSTLIKVQVVGEAAGYIEALDTNTKLVTVRGFDGKQYKFAFDSDSVVNEGGYTYSDFSRLTIGDRLMVTDSASDGRTFFKMQTRTSDVGVMQPSRIFLKNSNIDGDWTSYDLDKHCYIHQGSTTLTTNSFAPGTSATIYYVDRTAYELIKN